MTQKCVDASFIIAWLIPGQRTPAISARMDRYLQGLDDFVAPPLLEAEVASTLRRWAFQGWLTQEEGRDLLQDFLSLGIAIESPLNLYTRAYDLATTFNQSRAYDACYLALAELLSCELLTLDRRLYNAVAADLPHVRLVE